MNIRKAITNTTEEGAFAEEGKYHKIKVPSSDEEDD